MAKKKQVGRRVEGWKAKSWFKVHVPDNLGKAYIGDTIANDAESVVGRIMQATLGEIVNDYAKQHIKMSFKIATVTGDAAYTEFVGHEVTRDYLRSLVKRRSSRVDCQVPILTKDGKKVRLTISCYTFARANITQEHAIRKARNSRRPGRRMGLNNAPQRDCVRRDLQGSLQGSQDHLPDPQGRDHQIQGRACCSTDLHRIINIFFLFNVVQGISILPVNTEIMNVCLQHC
jgi:small subunit ribosomal protein S3Ae